ncbi:MAG: hypothetical protein ACRCX2_30245 [Paraclostridium sp.]
MPMTKKGLHDLTDRLIKDTKSSPAYNYIGVGNSSNAFVDTQEDLQATGSNVLRKVMDSGFPKLKSGTKNVVQCQTTFQKGEANFAWNEWGIFNAQTNGVMLNRVVQNNSTKLSNQVWVLAIELTFTAV